MGERKAEKIGEVRGLRSREDTSVSNTVDDPTRF